MDGGIGIASGLAGLITISAQLTQLIYGYVQDVRHASKSQRAYLSEVSALTDVLIRFEDVFDDVQTHPDIATSRPSSKLIYECHEKLDQHCAMLRRSISKFIWPFEAKELKKAMDDIHRFRSLFADQVAASTSMMTSMTLSEANSIKQEQDRATLLQALQAGDMVFRARPDFLPGTGAWLLNDPKFKAWMKSGSSMLWCYGAPGVGKSSLASMVITELLQRGESGNHHVLYHFCSFASRKQDTETTILRDILRQLAEQCEPDTVKFLLQRRHSIMASCSAKDIVDVFALCPLSQPMFVVVDGLDEIEAVKQMTIRLSALIKVGFRILVTSRDHPDIRTAFDDQTSINIKADQEDIKTFVADQFQASDFHDTVDMSHDLVEGAVARADGLFILAKLLTDQMLRATSIKQMRKCLVDSPVTISEAYTSSLKRIESLNTPSRDLALRLISWIVNAERALNPGEIIHAFALEPDDDEIDDDNLTRLPTLLRVCAGLVIVDKRTGCLELVHTTAYEFFATKKDNVTNAHFDLARTCLHYLNLQPLREKELIQVSEMDRLLAQLPFLHYASRHWGQHVLKSGMEQQLNADVRSLLDSEPARANSFLALCHQGVTGDEKLAVALFAAIPRNQSELHIAAYWGLPYVTKQLLEDGNDANSCNSRQWRPLHWAAHNGHTVVIKSLLSQGAEVNAKDERGWTALFWSSFYSNTTDIELLFANGADCGIKDASDWQALHWAVSRGQTRSVKALLDHHTKEHPSRPLFRSTKPRDRPPPRVKELEGESQELAAPKTLIEIAVDENEAEVFEMLLNAHFRGENPSFDSLWATGYFDPPLGDLWRTLNKAQKMHGVEHYLKASAYKQANSSESSQIWKGRLLHSAIKDSQLVGMRLLLELGADPDHKISKSPLHAAALRKDPEFTRLLLQFGANVNTKDDFGQTPLHQAVICGFEETVKALVNAGADVNIPVGPSCGHGRLDSIEGRTPLMLAYSSLRDGKSGTEARDAIVDCLLSAGADPTALNPMGNSLLHTVICGAELGTVSRLLDIGIDPDVQNNNGVAAIHLASEGYKLDTVKCLKGFGVNLSVRDHMGRNCFHYLSVGSDARHSMEDVQMLFDLLYPVLGNEGLNTCLSPIESVYSTADYDILRINSPLSSAIEHRNWQLCRIFLQYDAKLPSKTGILLRTAVEDLQVPIVRLLTRHGAELSGRSQFKSPRQDESAIDWLRKAIDKPLSKAEDLDAVLECLFEVGDVHLDQPDEKSIGETLLHKVILKTESEAFAKVLLKHGSNPFCKDTDGLDVFVKAAMNNKDMTFQSLLRGAPKPYPEKHWINHISHMADLNNDVQGYVCAAIKDSSNPNEASPFLTAALRTTNTALALRLIDAGIDPAVIDQYGWTQLHFATFHGCTEVVHRILLDGTVPINTVTKYWGSHKGGLNTTKFDWTWTGTPLHLAVLAANPDLVRYLLERGADPNINTADPNVAPSDTVAYFPSPAGGPTALRMAVRNDRPWDWRNDTMTEAHLVIARMLLDHGASIEGAAELLQRRSRDKFKSFEDVWTRIMGRDSIDKTEAQTNDSL